MLTERKPQAAPMTAPPMTEQAAPMDEQTAPMTEQAAPMTEQAAPMTEQAAPGHKPRRRKLSHEILGLLGVTLAISAFLFAFLWMTALNIVDNYSYSNDLTLTYTQSYVLEMWIFGLSLLTSVIFFIVLFLFLLGQKLAYVNSITKGIDALRQHRMDFVMPLEGNNELTQLAETINYLSATEKEMREKERALQEEREQLIRSLSHDIRTPLTSIMSYSELLTTQSGGTEYPELILKKAQQIKELTDILLDGSRRQPEYFEDARLLMEQLAAEMEEALEAAGEAGFDEALTGPPASYMDAPDGTSEAGETGGCRDCIDMSGCPAFSGAFDVGELRRVFDNLTSNILKYADLSQPVAVRISLDEGALVIRQENFVRTPGSAVESHHLGLASIRRIARNYGGLVEVEQDENRFAITIRLSEI